MNLKLNKTIFILFSALAICYLLTSFQNCAKFGTKSTQNSSFSSGALTTEKSYFANQGRELYDDMVVSPSQFTTTQMRSAKSVGFRFFQSAKWPNNLLLIDLHTYHVPNNVKELLQQACDQWTAGALIKCRFVEPGFTGNALVVSTHREGCWSSVGYYEDRSMIRTGLDHANHMNLSSDCWNRHITLHELGHAFGLNHEHQRFDRDNYIRVNYENILPEHRYSFDKGSLKDLLDYSKPYDLDSIMHYGQLTSHNIDANYPAYEVLDGRTKRTDFTVLSAQDRMFLIKVYGASTSANGAIAPPAMLDCIYHGEETPEGCIFAATSARHGEFAISSSRTIIRGSVSATCNNGVWVNPQYICQANQPPVLPAQHASCTYAGEVTSEGCTFGGVFALHGQQAVSYSTGGRKGQISATCIDGAWTNVSYSCQ